MDMLATLLRSGGVNALASQLGLSPATAATGTEALLPALLAGLRRHSEKAGGGEVGVRALVAMLAGLGGWKLAADIIEPGQPDVEPGNHILGEIFGPKDASRTIADHAAATTGLDAVTLNKMLPILAMLVGGYVAAQAARAEAESEGLAGVSGILDAAPGKAKGGWVAGGLGSVLDFGADGESLEELMRSAGKFTQR